MYTQIILTHCLKNKNSDRETGEPTEIVGLQLSNVDSEILKIENLIRMGIKPRIGD